MIFNFTEIAKKTKNRVEEQRAYATIGRVYLVQGQSLPSLVMSEEPLRNAERAFLKSLNVCKEKLVRLIEIIKEFCTNYFFTD